MQHPPAAFLQAVEQDRQRCGVQQSGGNALEQRAEFRGDQRELELGQGEHELNEQGLLGAARRAASDQGHCLWRELEREVWGRLAELERGLFEELG